MHFSLIYILFIYISASVEVDLGRVTTFIISENNADLFISDFSFMIANILLRVF